MQHVFLKDRCVYAVCNSKFWFNTISGRFCCTALVLHYILWELNIIRSWCKYIFDIMLLGEIEIETDLAIIKIQFIFLVRNYRYAYEFPVCVTLCMVCGWWYL